MLGGSAAVRCINPVFTVDASSKPGHRTTHARNPTTMKCSAALRDRDAIIRQYLQLADAIAGRFARRYQNLIDRDDAIGVARLALVEAAARAKPGPSCASYLQICIAGALAHWLRDKALMVRLPKGRRDAIPWRHWSLDDQASEGFTFLDLIEAPEPEPEPIAEMAAELELILDRLTAADAALLRLRLLQGMTLRSAAAELGIATMTVLRRERLAVARLQQERSI